MRQCIFSTGRNRFYKLSTALIVVTVIVMASIPVQAVKPPEELTSNKIKIQPSADQDILTPKALQRRYDVVVVTGDLLPEFLGEKISHLRLYAYTEGKLHPIAYQVDEKDAEGRFVCTDGPQAGEDIDKGRLDVNDELIFVAGHAGSRIAPKLWPKGSSIGHEIVVRNPLDPSKQAWAYLLYFPEIPPPPAKEDYVDYDPEHDKLVGKYYSIGYKKGYMLFTDIIYPEASGGNNLDILDRLKFRVNVHLLGGMVRLHRTEEDIRCNVVGWIDGPVRVIRVTENSFRILFNIPSPSLYATTEYYPNYFTVPMRISIPFNMKYVMNAFVIKGFHVIVVGDFLEHMKGMKAHTPRNPEGFILTGNTSEEEAREKYNLSKLASAYLGYEGKGSWFVRLAFPECIIQYFNIYFHDNMQEPNPPEDEPGEIAGGAFVYSDSLEKKYGVKNSNPFDAEVWNLFQAGTVELAVDTYIAPPTLKWEETKEWYDIRDYPLEVDVTGEKKESNFVLGETEPELIKAVIFDRKGRKISLRDLFFHYGSLHCSGWQHVIGYQIETKRWYKIPFNEIKQMDFRIEEIEHVSGLRRPLYITVTKKDNSVVDLFNAKVAGFAGHIDQDQKFFLWNPLIERIELKDSEILIPEKKK